VRRVVGCRRNAITRRAAALSVALASMLALPACDYFSSVDRIGASIGDDRSVQIIYLACDYEQISAVSLYDGHDPNTGDDDELIWEIRSAAGADGGVFTVGSEPEGFVETVPFDGTLAENLIAVIEIEDAGGEALDFAPTDLQPEMVLASGNPNENMDPGAFEQQARESCQSP